jgi:thermitase
MNALTHRWPLVLLALAALGVTFWLMVTWPWVPGPVMPAPDVGMAGARHQAPVVPGEFLMRDTPINREAIERNVNVDLERGTLEPAWRIEDYTERAIKLRKLDPPYMIVHAPVSADRSSIVDMQPNYVAYMFDDVNDPYAGQQYSLDRMQVREAWDVSHGSGTVVAVLDTGTDATHPDLAAKVLAGYDFVNRDENATDDHGHGTHVSGIVCAATNNGVGVAGVGYDCQVMPVKVLNAAGSGNHADIAAGIVWATDHGAQVINMSLGGLYPSDVLHQAVRYATDRGVNVVAAAGNDGSTQDNYPAAYPEAISVCATDSNDNVAAWSNRAASVDVCTPGVGVLSTVRGGTYQAWSGTSMATPNAAGVIALLRAAGRDASAARARLEGTLDQVNAPRGRVNAARALAGAVGPTLTPMPTGVPRPTATLPVATSTPEADEPGEFVRLVNQERAAQGLPALNRNERLSAASHRHVLDLAGAGRCSHTGSDGSDPGERIADAGYVAATWGEVVCCGCGSAAGAVAAFKGSTPHWAILMGAYLDIGVAKEPGRGIGRSDYWVAVLAVPAGGPMPTVTPVATWTPMPPTLTATTTRNPTATPVATWTPAATPTGLPAGEVVISGGPGVTAQRMEWVRGMIYYTLGHQEVTRSVTVIRVRGLTPAQVAALQALCAAWPERLKCNP